MVSLDKRNRNGKEVSLVSRFIGDEDDLKELCKALKVKLGVGGAVKDGNIIIQGDHRQKIYDNFDSIVYALKQTSQNQNEINENLSKLNEQIKNINNHSLGLDEKLSNFLSTQLNTQSSILQLINKINDDGILGKSTKKIFDDLNKSIQEFNSNNKK